MSCHDYIYGFLKHGSLPLLLTASQCSSEWFRHLSVSFIICFDLCPMYVLLQTELIVWAQLAFCNQTALSGPLMHCAQLRSVCVFCLVSTDGSGQVLRLLLCSCVTESCNIAFCLCNKCALQRASSCLYTLMKLFVTAVYSSDGQGKWRVLGLYLPAACILNEKFQKRK